MKDKTDEDLKLELKSLQERAALVNQELTDRAKASSDVKLERADIQGSCERIIAAFGDHATLPATREVRLLYSVNVPDPHNVRYELKKIFDVRYPIRSAAHLIHQVFFAGTFESQPKLGVYVASRAESRRLADVEDLADAFNYMAGLNAMTSGNDFSYDDLHVLFKALFPEQVKVVEEEYARLKVILDQDTNPRLSDGQGERAGEG
jgi:hypothetical protein